ncbi:LysR family transcriptional regulator [Actinosynnema sp. NPDC023658]|uniref:LysR family transcriptional regulator n=1 Tax=Actinosynnema sp. NPDC023658 TaxID=3155465 RepID=UPI0033EF3E23
MELRQLEYFVAVAEERNFTRAAERVHISQSGVSAQIRQLERELGAELFDRSGRAVTLTVAGKAALDPARAALAAAGAVGQAVDEVTHLVRGRLTVGMVVGCTITALFDALATFHRAHPAVEVSLVEGNSGRLVADVHDGSVDLALVGTSTTTPDGLDAWTIIDERLVAAVPAGHPLAVARRTTLTELVAHPLVCMPAGTGLRTVFDQACAARSLRPTIALEASAADAIAALAGRGLAVAVLSESMAGHYADRLVTVPIDDLDTPALLSLVWKNDHNPAVRRLVTCCRQAFAGG